MKTDPIYRRILLKCSGEYLAGKAKYGIDPAILKKFTKRITELVDMGVQVAIVIGGGNLFRGQPLSIAGMDRITADHIGMLATIMNALALRDSCEREGYPALVMSAITVSGIVDTYDCRQAKLELQKGKILIFSGGTGNPLVTTDSAASLRAIEIKADILIKATNVDGIYASDPRLDPKATKYKFLTYSEAISKELEVMDLSAFSQCRDHGMKIKVFGLQKEDGLLRVVTGKDEGTLVG